MKCDLEPDKIMKDLIQFDRNPYICSECEFKSDNGEIKLDLPSGISHIKAISIVLLIGRYAKDWANLR